MSSSAHIPASFAEVVVTNTNFSSPSRGIYISGAGDVSAVMLGDGATVLFEAVPAGSVLPIRCTKINTTNTTATNMIVLW
jgi:hypothetical protein